MSAPLDRTASRAIPRERRQATIVRSASTSRRAARFHQGESAIVPAGESCTADVVQKILTDVTQFTAGLSRAV
jgi:hypothetical protein